MSASLDMVVNTMSGNTTQAETLEPATCVRGTGIIVWKNDRHPFMDDYDKLVSILEGQSHEKEA